MTDLHEQLDKYNNEQPLPDGDYHVTVADAQGGDDHIFLHLALDDGRRTKVRLTFKGDAMEAALANTQALGIQPPPGNVNLARDVAPLFVGRAADVRLSTYTGDSGTFQSMVPPMKGAAA